MIPSAQVMVLQTYPAVLVFREGVGLVVEASVVGASPRIHLVGLEETILYKRCGSSHQISNFNFLKKNPK